MDETETDDTIVMEDDTTSDTTTIQVLRGLRDLGFFDLAEQMAAHHEEPTGNEDDTSSMGDEDDTTPSEVDVDDTTTSEGAHENETSASDTEDATTTVPAFLAAVTASCVVAL